MSCMIIVVDVYADKVGVWCLFQSTAVSHVALKATPAEIQADPAFLINAVGYYKMRLAKKFGHIHQRTGKPADVCCSVTQGNRIQKLNGLITKELRDESANCYTYWSWDHISQPVPFRESAVGSWQVSEEMFSSQKLSFCLLLSFILLLEQEVVEHTITFLWSNNSTSGWCNPKCRAMGWVTQQNILILKA